MREFQEKKTARKVIFSWPVLVVITALSLWMVYGTISAMFTLQEIYKKNRDLEKKTADVTKSKAALEEKVENMKTEYGIDLEARKNFNLKKPEEEVILFIEE